MIEESGWKTRGRPSSSGSFQPRAVLRHWDASSNGSHNVNVLINGNGSADGPLCSIWTCDGDSGHEASVHVIAAGRCNHGGTGDGWGLIPRDDANTYAVGHEIRQTVNEPWPADQLEQVRMAEAAILAKLGEQASNGLCSHSEYAPDRKIDTTEGSHGQSMGSERSAVQSIITDGPGADDMRMSYVSVSTAHDIEATANPKRVTFEKESSDASGAHTSGKGGIVALWPCVMQGVVEVLTDGPVRVGIERTDSGETGSTEVLADVPAGRSLVPFVASWSEGQVLYVQVSTIEGTATVGSVGLQLTQLERM